MNKPANLLSIAALTALSTLPSDGETALSQHCDFGQLTAVEKREVCDLIGDLRLKLQAAAEADNATVHKDRLETGGLSYSLLTPYKEGDSFLRLKPADQDAKPLVVDLFGDEALTLADPEQGRLVCNNPKEATGWAEKIEGEDPKDWLCLYQKYRKPGEPTPLTGTHNQLHHGVKHEVYFAMKSSEVAQVKGMAKHISQIRQKIGRR